MKFLTPKISLSSLNEKELKIFHSLGKEIYGRELALKVAENLKRNPIRLNENGHYVGSGGLYHSHRDYCGIGLYYFEGKFTLGEVNDGMGPYPIIAESGTEIEFLEWLTNESDQSMAMYGEQFNNQTITKIRLEWFLEENYNSVWNAYCLYCKNRNIEVQNG